ncbi:2-hydroxychromene-2-carboxylate isomerase [Sorangium sp. So ce296]|uniref:2-hydroxychromene-2-carboxylate isomerase n=1 Tax=Sorangium sp. So ce296 TaxID=3133296 RepID=UPI003F5D84E6
MAKAVTFYFDFGSPTSYLAWTQLPRIAEETGATIDWRPVLLGGIFKATGNRSPVEIPAKGAYMLRDMQRFAARYGVPFTMNPHFPVNTLTLMRAAVGVQLRHPERFLRFIEAVYKALWVEAKDIGDPAVAAGVIRSAGLDPGEVMALTNHPEIKEKLRAETDAAVGRGLFGAPTMFVGDEMFWGQDRLDFVRDALKDAA